MRVQATRVGHYGQLRQPGDEFDIRSPKEFSKLWMKNLSRQKRQPAAEPAPAPAPAAEETGEGAE